MSEPKVPQPEGEDNVEDVVDSAKAALADAEAAADARATEVVADTEAVAESVVEDAAAKVDAKVDAKTDAADADMAAFEEAERAFPGTFGGTFTPQPPAAVVEETVVVEETIVVEEAPVADDVAATAAAATIAYAATDAAADDAPTQIVASEPAFVPPVAQQPIFVQAPEAPRERGNRGTAGAIGLLAALSFAILYLGAALGLGALAGNVTLENIGTAALELVASVSFWVTVVVFYLSFWLLGAIINRGRWGHWAIFGLFVGFAAYGGHLLGLLIEAPFWTLTAEAGATLIGSQMLAPMAIAAFLFARELTMWFGAWVARSGARKTVQNAEAQREYERTLEAGPQLPY